MSGENSRTLLTVGVFFITIVVAVLLYVTQLITDWLLIIPLVILLNGLWFIGLAAIRAGSAGKYERGPFSTAAMGLIAVAVGGAWFLASVNWLYSLVVILLVVAGLAIAAALQRK
jgi:hypothetical protein